MEVGKSSLLKRCASAIVYGVGGAVGSRVLMFLANIFLSRMLGQVFFGQYSSLSSTVNLFVTFSGMGVSATLTRYVAAYRHDKEKLGVYIRTLSSICMGMSVALSIVMLFFARQISQLSTGGSELTSYFRVVAISVFFASMSAVEQSIQIGFEQFQLSSVIQLIRCGLFLGLSVILSRRWGIYGAVYALMLSHGVQYFASIFVNKKFYYSQGIQLKWHWNTEIRYAAVSYAVPAFISGLCVVPVQWIGNAMLTRTAGFEQMAVFTVCNQWMQYVTYIPSQMGQMRPIYTDLYVNDDRKKLKGLVGKVTLSTTGIAAAIALVLILASNMILSMYGSAYTDGSLAFVFMISAAVLFTAQVQTGFVLQAMNKMWLSVGINILWGIILLVSYCFLLRYEAIGYAFSFCIAYLVNLFIQLAIVHRCLTS